MRKLAFNSIGLPTEPSAATKREVGTLCASWAFLEAVSDSILHHLYEATPDIIALLNQKMEMRSKWESIRTQAKVKLTDEQFNEVKRVAALVEKVTADRNVVVHGEIIMFYPDESAPFWVVRKGANAGKRFPVSTNAVKTIRLNIQKVGNETHELAKAIGCKFDSQHSRGPWAIDWPKPL